MFKSYFPRLLIAFAIAALMLVPTMQVSANDIGWLSPSLYQVRSAVIPHDALPSLQVQYGKLLTPSFKIGATDTIKPNYGGGAYSKVNVGSLLIGTVGGYKDRPGWQYRKDRL